MADILNLPNLGGTTNTLNTGFPLGDIIRDIPLGMFLLDAGKELNSGDRASIVAAVAALKTASRAARGARAYPIWSLTDFQDNTKAPTKAQIGNLAIQELQLVDAIPAFEFQHRKGDLFHQLLLRAEAGGFTILLVDKKYVLYGTKTAGGNFTGYTFDEFKAQLPKFQTPQAPSHYPFSIVFSSITEWKENFAFLQLDSTIAGISGIRDVVLSQFSMVTNVLKVKLVASGGKNFATMFSTELTQATAWVVKDATGASVTVSAAYDSTNGVMALTLSGTPWTGASTSAPFTCDLAPCAILAAGPINIDGYESTGVLNFTKP